MSFSSSNNSYNLEQDSYFNTNNADSLSSPEKKLLLGILERAILDFVGNDVREAKEAELWIFEDTNFDLDEPSFSPSPYTESPYTKSPKNTKTKSDYVFSFAGVCQQLDLNVDSIRKIIIEMPKRGESRVAPWYKNRKDKVKKVQ